MKAYTKVRVTVKLLCDPCTAMPNIGTEGTVVEDCFCPEDKIPTMFYAEDLGYAPVVGEEQVVLYMPVETLEVLHE